MEAGQKKRRRWRYYETTTGKKPVKDFIDKLSDEDAAEVVAGMKEVALHGVVAGRYLQGNIYEVRVEGDRVIYRILFASEGRSKQILLALEGVIKKTQKTPQRVMKLAERRLADWRERGQVQAKKLTKKKK